jgi:hypothetical protein
MPRVEISEAAAPAITVVEKVRLFIIMICLPSMAGIPGNGSWQNSSGTVHSGDVTTVEIVTPSCPSTLFYHADAIQSRRPPMIRNALTA